MDYEAKIKELEHELSTTKYNKRTQHHIGLVKAKIARLKQEQEKLPSKKGKHTGYAIKKTGDATVVLLGFPSVGKSTLLNKITNADSEIGHYDFTTLNVIPGMLIYNGARIQILDVPGIIEGAAKGAGRGKEVLGIARNADLLIIVLDPKSYEKADIIKKELYEFGIRVNLRPPDVKITKRPYGGIDIGATVKLSLDEETIKAVLREFGFINASVVIRENINIDKLIDVLSGNRVYIPGMTVMNKADMINDSSSFKDIDLFISAENGMNLNKLKQMIFEKLSLIRVYTKDYKKPVNFDEPMILKKGARIRDVCLSIHRDFVKRFRYAKVWGSSKFPGQKQGLEYELKDRDIVQLFLD